MKNNATILLAVFLLSVLTAGAQDILRFTNADQLHGSFLGIQQEDEITWKRDDLEANMLFSTKDIRSIVFPQNQSFQTTEYSYIRLKNDDIIPGKVTSLDGQALKLSSEIVGDIEIPRAYIAQISPQPFGGNLLYAGPFSPDGWVIIEPPTTKEDQKKSPPEPSVAETAKAQPADGKKPQQPWQHIGTSWYRKDSPLPLARKECLPELSLLRFRAQWRGRFNINVILHADFMPPPPSKEGENKNADNEEAAGMMFMQNGQSAQHQTFGNALVLNIYQSYLSLLRVGYNKEGKLSIERVSQSHSSVSLQESGEATFEIRSDKTTGLMLLYVDGNYAAQWENLRTDAEADDPATMMPLGSGLAFQVSSGKLPLRISDIVIAEWNGVRDSARSYVHEKRDVALLHNGTDRYSGKLLEITDNNAHFKSSLGKLQIPLTDLAELHFAHKKNEPPQPNSDKSLSAIFYPIGKISGEALQADRKSLKMKHSMLGEITAKLDRSISLQFSDETSFLHELQFEKDQLEIQDE